MNDAGGTSPKQGAAATQSTVSAAEKLARRWKRVALVTFAHLSAMGKYGRLRRRLQNRVAKYAAAAANEAVSGGDAGEDMRRLEELQKVLAALPRRNELYSALAIGVLCLLVVSVTLSPAPTTGVQFTVRSAAVKMRLKSKLRWPGTWQIKDDDDSTNTVKVQQVVDLKNVGQLDLPPEFPIDALSGRAWLHTSGGDVKLTAFTIYPGAEITVTNKNAGRADLFVQDQRFTGEMRLAGKPKIWVGSAAQSKIEPDPAMLDMPETLKFSDDGRSSIPVQLRTSQRIALPDLQIDELSLKPNELTDFEGESYFASAISNGTMKILDTGEEFDLSGADIVLEGAQGRVSGLTVGGSDLQFTFDGEARNVSLEDQSLRATWLAYLFHRKEFLGLFWSGITVLFGLLWSARKLFFAESRAGT